MDQGAVPGPPSEPVAEGLNASSSDGDALARSVTGWHSPTGDQATKPRRVIINNIQRCTEGVRCRLRFIPNGVRRDNCRWSTTVYGGTTVAGPRCTDGVRRENSLWTTVYGRCTVGVRRCTAGAVLVGVRRCTAVYGRYVVPRAVARGTSDGRFGPIIYIYWFRRLVSGWCPWARYSSP